MAIACLFQRVWEGDRPGACLLRRRGRIPRPFQLNREVFLREPALVDGLVCFLEGHHFPALPPKGDADDPVEFARPKGIGRPPVRQKIGVAHEPQRFFVDRRLVMQQVTQERPAGVVGTRKVVLGRKQLAESTIELRFEDEQVILMPDAKNFRVGLNQPALVDRHVPLVAEQSSPTLVSV